MSNPPNYRDLITDYLSLCRSHHNTLNNIISTISSSNQNISSIIANLIHNTNGDVSNNSQTNQYTQSNQTFQTNNRRRRRPRSNPPPPPPTQSSTSNIRYMTPSRRRRGTTTFYTPFFPTTTTNRSTLSNFINTTLWDNSNISSPASISTILNNSKIHIWRNIRSEHPNTERCPIDLSLLVNDDIVIQLNQCKHIFKYVNIFRWFAINSRCPVCRHDISNPVISDSSNNISLNVQDLSNNSINNNNDISNNNNDISNNDNYDDDNLSGEIENIRRRVENLLNLDTSANIITADITIETFPLSNHK